MNFEIATNFILVDLNIIKKKNIMSLADAPNNINLKVSNISSREDFRRRLFSMGVFINDLVTKQNVNKNGPVLIKNLSNGSSKIALGRILANQIFVEYDK